MFQITQASVSDVTKLICPHCCERVPRVGIMKNSRIEGLTFKCRKCGLLWQVKTE